jgi:hypothetical protein
LILVLVSLVLIVNSLSCMFLVISFSIIHLALSNLIGLDNLKKWLKHLC